jgi:hypothetical protein
MRPEVLAAHSRAWCTRSEVELVVTAPSESVVVRGAFERPNAGELRRGSGGAAVRVGPGTLWIQLSLPRPDALVACPPGAIVNRYVRPLLRTLTRVTGTPASYFGRDWVSVAHRPVAAVGFAYEARTGRTLFEAIVGVNEPFATEARPSFRGKSPVTLAELAGAVDPLRLAAAIEEAYAVANHEPTIGSTNPPGEAIEPPWTAFREEAIGVVAAGPDRHGRLRIGGEIMGAYDVVAELASEAATAPIDAIGEIVDRHAARAVLFGIRSFASIRDVIVEARQNMA